MGGEGFSKTVNMVLRSGYIAPFCICCAIKEVVLPGNLGPAYVDPFVQIFFSCLIC